MDRLLAMRAFQAVVDQGGFAAAARSMNLSPAGVTRLVADLEEHLRTRLLQRTTRKFVLTDAGEAYLLRLRSVLHEIDDADAAASEHTSELNGSLNVLATPILASYFLAPRLAQWHRQYPKVSLHLSVDPFPQQRIEEFDVSFLILEQGHDANVVARSLGATDWIVCASPDYLSRASAPNTPSDLSAHSLLEFEWPQAGQHRAGVIRLLRQSDDEVVSVDCKPILRTNSFEVLLRAAVDGAGITVLSRLLAAPFIDRGSLVHLLPGWTFGRFVLYAALPTRKFVPARTRAFLDFLTEQAKGVLRPGG